HQVLDDLKRVFHHHMTLVDRYVISRYPGRITLFRPFDAPFAVASPHDRGWGRLAADVEGHVVPGQHHTMVQEPHVRDLAQARDACLRRKSDKGSVRGEQRSWQEASRWNHVRGGARRAPGESGRPLAAACFGPPRVRRDAPTTARTHSGAGRSTPKS